MSSQKQIVPAIRFKSYADDWEQRKLEELVVERNEQQPENSKYPLMSFTAIDGVTPKSDRYNREFLVKSNDKKYKKTKFGDLIYSSNNLDVGSIGINKTGNAVISPVYSIFYPKDGITSDFVGMLIQRKKFINKMIQFRQGVVYGQWRIHESDFLKIETRVPSTDEQNKIGSFFKQIDDTIALHQRQLDNYKELKKAMLQKVFNQELRFKDENGNEYSEWQKKKIGDFVTTFSGGTPSSSKQSYYNGDIPFIRSGEINSSETELYISEEGLKDSAANLVEQGDLLYALYGATSGEVGISKIAGAINQAILCIRTEESIIFLSQFFKYNKKSILIKYLQGGQGNLSAQIVKDLDISLPSMNEQIKIGEFFEKFDEKIEFQMKIVSKLSEQKKDFCNLCLYRLIDNFLKGTRSIQYEREIKKLVNFVSS